MKIAVKFCGHCMSAESMYKVYDQLVLDYPDYEFCYYSKNPKADKLLILNACEVRCAKVENFKGPVIVVSPSNKDQLKSL